MYSLCSYLSHSFFSRYPPPHSYFFNRYHIWKIPSPYTPHVRIFWARFPKNPWIFTKILSFSNKRTNVKRVPFPCDIIRVVRIRKKCELSVRLYYVVIRYRCSPNRISMWKIEVRHFRIRSNCWSVSINLLYFLIRLNCKKCSLDVTFVGRVYFCVIDPIIQSILRFA